MGFMEPRRPRHLTVRDELEALVASEMQPGSLLPSESEMCSRLKVSRVTLRRALGDLREAGLLASRQGFGWFVPGEPMHSALDVLQTIDDQITASGRRPVRKLLKFAFVASPDRVGAVLSSPTALEITRLNLADDEPVGCNTAWVPADLAGTLSMQAVERDSLHHLLPVNLGRATQTITAEGASKDQGELLGLPEGGPVLSFRRTTYDDTGRAVLYSEAVYHPLRTEFSIDLPAAGKPGSALRARATSSA